MGKRFWMSFVALALFATPGCTPDGADFAMAEAQGDECTPDGLRRDCNCDDGADGTQTCEDGQWGECYCRYWPDDDGDGYGEEGSRPVEDTTAPNDYADNDDDCDDNDRNQHPGAKEVCDGQDNDCDGKVDEGCPDVENCTNGVDDDNDGLVDCADPDCADSASCGGDEYTHYRDGDGDGYTNGEYIKDSNPNAPVGYTNSPKPGIDCNDNNAAVNPGATEVCGNNIDDNCNGSIDEGCVTAEVCNNGVDDDGDGLVDCNDPDCANASNCGGTEHTYWRDGDGDGYTTNESITTTSATPPNGYRAQKSTMVDCNDNNAAVNPGATEVCGNNIDDNCNGSIDEGCVTQEVCNNGVDDDGDGLVDCADPDCANASNCQQADEVCDNGMDDDGDGLVDCADPDCSSATNCQNVGTVTLKFEVDCGGQSWVQNVQPQGSWAGRNYGNLPGCIVSGTRASACTFEIPAPDFPTFVGQGDIGFGRYSGDGSGNAPAPCVTPAQVEAMQGTSITLLCTHRLWKDGVPVSQKWESNGVMKPSGTQSCSESGSFPYYNSRPLVQTMSGTWDAENLTQDQMLGARFVVEGEVLYWIGGETLDAGWRSLETLEPNDVLWLGKRNPFVRVHFPSFFPAE